MMMVKMKRNLCDVTNVLAAVTVHCEHERDKFAERNHHLIVAKSHKRENE